jgi:hypothetical protein
VEFLEADGRHERGVRSCVESVCAGRMNGEVCWSKCCGDRVMRSRYGERNREQWVAAFVSVFGYGAAITEKALYLHFRIPCPAICPRVKNITYCVVMSAPVNHDYLS